MAASINASTSAGVVTTADTTGNLNLQSNGATVLAMTSAGVAVTGTQSVTGLISVGAGGINFTSAAGTSFVSGSTASTFTWDGSGGTSGSITINYQIIGKFCTLTLQAVLATTGTSSTTLASNTALPAAFRPVANTGCAIPITNNGAAIAPLGFLVLGTAGILYIVRDPTGAVFTNSATAGLQQGISLTYLVA